MQKSVFLDTSGLFALLISGDQNHIKAKEVLSKYRTSSTIFILTDYIIDELFTLMAVRGHKNLCSKAMEYLELSNAIELEFVGPELFYAAKGFFLRQIDKSYSFTDCVSFILMKELKINTAFTFDLHFKQAGFKVLPDL